MNSIHYRSFELLMELEQKIGVVFGGFGVTRSLNSAQRSLGTLQYGYIWKNSSMGVFLLPAICTSSFRFHPHARCCPIEHTNHLYNQDRLPQMIWDPIPIVQKRGFTESIPNCTTPGVDITLQYEVKLIKKFHLSTPNWEIT